MKRTNKKTRKTKSSTKTLKSVKAFAGTTPSTKSAKNRIVKTFMEMMNTIKLYHWKTLSYAQHKATDELHDSMQSHVDKFVEVLLGKDESRLNIVDKRIETTLDVHINQTTPKSQPEFQQKILGYRGFLTDLDVFFDGSEDSDLLNIRDELLADVNKFLYLFALK